jgi:hypothetical protein
MMPSLAGCPFLAHMPADSTAIWSFKPRTAMRWCMMALAIGERQILAVQTNNTVFTRGNLLGEVF